MRINNNVHHCITHTVTAETITKHSPSLDKNAEYTKTMAISRLPGYMTIQMVR